MKEITVIYFFFMQLTLRDSLSATMGSGTMEKSHEQTC